MDHLEHPTADLWTERREWIERLTLEQEQRAGFLIGEQASALSEDVQAVCTRSAVFGDVIAG